MFGILPLQNMLEKRYVLPGTAMTGDLAVTWTSILDILNCSKHPAWWAGLIVTWLELI